MCDLVSMMVASTALSGVSSVMQGQADAAAANYNAKIQAQNAIFADQRAEDARLRGQLEEQRVREQGNLVRKGQEARWGASGLDMGFGSPLDVIVASATRAELDAMTVRENTEREVEDFEREAWSLRAGSSMSKAEARNAKTAGALGAVGSVLTGGAGIYKYKAGVYG